MGVTHITYIFCLHISYLFCPTLIRTIRTEQERLQSEELKNLKSLYAQALIVNEQTFVELPLPIMGQTTQPLKFSISEIIHSQLSQTACIRQIGLSLPVR